MDDNIAISVNNVYKNFVLPHERVNSVKSAFTNMIKTKKSTSETQHALKDISFEIKKGEFFGIVGRNGSGKSTLLKILAGIYQPTQGSVKTQGKLVPFIELGVGFNHELTGRENVYLNGAMLGFSQKEVEAMYDEIVAFAELEKFMDQKLKNYSSGMQVRLAFSMATRAEADILLVDEVLAVGDADFQRKCFAYFKKLKKNHKTVVFVTHDMNAIREFCDVAALIDRNELQLIGSPSEVSKEYSRLFIDESQAAFDNTSDTKKRWGNGAVRFSDYQVKLEDNNLFVSSKAEVNKPVDSLLYGIHVFSEDGSEVTATNNRMIEVSDITNLSKGDVISFEWKMLNIFNDGQYYISLTLADDEGNTLDWFNEVLTFTVKRIERSTTAVIPPLSVIGTVQKNKKG